MKEDQDVELVRDWLIYHPDQCAVNRRATYGPCDCGLVGVNYAFENLVARLELAERT